MYEPSCPVIPVIIARLICPISWRFRRVRMLEIQVLTAAPLWLA